MFLEEILGQAGNSMGLLLAAGFLVGLLHALEPDHVTAMVTQVRSVRKERVGGEWSMSSAPAGLKLAALRNSLLGAFWGFGHTSMILLVSFLVFVFAFNIPPAIFDGAELAVGFMLVILGVSMCCKMGRVFKWKHSHQHTHQNGITHSHPHTHGRSGHPHTHKSYLIGCLHGLAGSGGLIAVGAVTMGDVFGAFSFVLVFGIGSVAGMAAVSGALSAPLLLSSRLVRLRTCLRILSGSVTAAVGLAVIYGLATSGELFVFI